MPAADSSSLDFKQWGLLAIQDGGRRKPIDTFAREALIKTTGRSSYTDKRGKKWQANDFLLSMLLDTHEWKSERLIQSMLLSCRAPGLNSRVTDNIRSAARWGSSFANVS